MADETSSFDEYTEWELVDSVFREVTLEIGDVKIDLFPSRLNKM